MWYRLVLLVAGSLSLVASCGGRFESSPGGGAGGDTGGTGASGGSGGTGASGGTGGTGGTGGSQGGFSACELNSECVIVPASCCGSCGAATSGDAFAAHRDRLNDYREFVCDPGQGCPACFMANDPTIVATCNGGICSIVELLEQSYTECSTDADCRLRTNACCECSDIGRETLIALNHEKVLAFTELVCDPNTACDDCIPIYPIEATPYCDAGHCTVVWAL